MKENLDERIKNNINKPQKKKKRRKNYKFSDKTHPIFALASVGLAVLSIGNFTFLCIQSALLKGTSGIFTGLFGIILLFLSIGGFILAILSFRKQEIHYRFPVLGMLLNGTLIITFIIIYVLGAVG